MRDEISAGGAPLAGSGYDGAGGCAEEEPFGGAVDASPSAAAFGDADGVVALFREGGGFGFFVAERNGASKPVSRATCPITCIEPQEKPRAQASEAEILLFV
jgi:hypothetical protein